MIVDTQIISYCHSGYWNPELAKNVEISSVTASEFLLFHTRENSKVDYYVINPARYGKFHSVALLSSYSEHAKNSKWAKMGANRTDSVVIDFAKDYQSYRMFGNEAISEIINKKNIDAFRLSIAHLGKNKQKILKKKIEFILDNDMVCHRVNENVCNIGMDLFERFKVNIKPKENIKNTVNDLLILSTAIDRNVDLYTKDKVLGLFAADNYNGKVTEKEDGLIIDFSDDPKEISKRKRESKGYINRGWSYSFLKGNL